MRWASMHRGMWLHLVDLVAFKILPFEVWKRKKEKRWLKSEEKKKKIQLIMANSTHNKMYSESTYRVGGNA